MAEAHPPKLPARKPRGRKPAEHELAEQGAAESGLGTASLRKLARSHTKAALQVLAEVATKGSSEASRISAAMALLDRGYGKTGTTLGGEYAPILFQRIELIDGSEDSSGRDQQTGDSSAPGHQD